MGWGMAVALLLRGAAALAASTDPNPDSGSLAKHAVPIAPGVELPLVSLGGVPSRPSNWSLALTLGARGIDTALTYGDLTQKKVAAAIGSQTAVPRKDIFLTTKVPCCPNVFGPFPGAHCTVAEFNGSVAKDVAENGELLGTVPDLTLMHWPCITEEQTLATWRGLEAAQAAGKTRSIGVSNFNASLLDKLLPKMMTKPAANQCGHSIGHHTANQTKQTDAEGYYGGDDTTVDYCQTHNITYMAYSPLGGLSGLDVFKNPVVAAVGKKHGVSAAQVALRWLVQRGIAVVTAADNAAYITEDISIFSFELSDEDMKMLATL